MAEPQTNPPFQRAKSGQVREALDRLEGLVVDGLKHGFFDYSVACEVANGGKRPLVIRAGKSHKVTIPENEVPRQAPFDPRSLRRGRLKMQIKFGPTSSVGVR